MKATYLSSQSVTETQNNPLKSHTTFRSPGIKSRHSTQKQAKSHPTHNQKTHKIGKITGMFRKGRKGKCGVRCHVRVAARAATAVKVRPGWVGEEPQPPSAISPSPTSSLPLPSERLTFLLSQGEARLLPFLFQFLIF